MNKLVLFGTPLLIAAAIFLTISLGIGGCGPTNTITATVIDKHVDVSGGKNTTTNFIVTTDQGSFEIDNGILLGVWNADELFGRLERGQTYTFTTKGRKYVNPFLQYYPYIVDAQ